MRAPSVCVCCGGAGRERPRGADVAAVSGPRFERERRRGARVWEDAGCVDGPGWLRETLEALREGGPRKREGGGARWG